MSCGITTHVVSVEWPLQIETIKTSNDRAGYLFIFGAITQFGAFQTQFKGERTTTTIEHYWRHTERAKRKGVDGQIVVQMFVHVQIFSVGGVGEKRDQKLGYNS